MPAPQTRAFQQDAFQDDSLPTDAFQKDAFQPNAFQAARPPTDAFQRDAFQTTLVETGTAPDYVGRTKAWPLWRKIPGRRRRGEGSTIFALTQGPQTQTVSGVGAIPSEEAFGSLGGRGEDDSYASRTKAWPLWRKIPGRRRRGEGSTVFAISAPDVAVEQTVSGVGAIPSAEAFGSTKLRRILGLIGIDSSEAVGTPTKSPQIVLIGGIPSEEAFGTARVVGGVVVEVPPSGGGAGPGAVIAPAAREGRQVVVTLVAGPKRVVLFDKRV